MEVNVCVSADDAVNELGIDQDIVNPSFVSSAVLPCPRFIALPLFEGGRRGKLKLAEELAQEGRIFIVVFSVVVSMELSDSGSHPGICIKQGNDFDGGFGPRLHECGEAIPPL